MNEEARSDSPDTRPLIDEIVGLLDRRSPQQLSLLRMRFGAAHDPKVANLLSPGQTLGPETSDQYWPIAATAVSEALDVAIKESDLAINRTKPQLSSARNWQLASSLVAVLGPASIWTVVAKSSQAFAEYISAAFTLIGGLFAVMTQFKQQQKYGAGNLLKAYGDLIDIKATSQTIKREIDLRISRGLIGPSDEDLIKQANDLCRKITGFTAAI